MCLCKSIIILIHFAKFCKLVIEINWLIVKAQNYYEEGLCVKKKNMILIKLLHEFNDNMIIEVGWLKTENLMNII